MTYSEYIKKVNYYKAQAEARFVGLTTFEQKMIDAGYGYLIGNLKVKGNTLEVPANLPTLLDGFVDSILQIANSSKTYQTAISSYLADLNSIYKNIADFQKDYNQIIIAKPGVKKVQEAVVNEIVNQYSENGLNVHFAAPLRDSVYGNILAGMSQNDVRTYLNDYIKGGNDQSGKLKSYLTQTAQQGADSYEGGINMRLKKEFVFTGYTISGSLIATSSKQCKLAIDESKNGYLDFAAWEKILQIARQNKAATLIEGTTIDNLPLNKLHWGCRHSFTPTIKK